MKETGRNRVLVPLPFGVAELMGSAFDLGAMLVPPPLTADQVRMLKTDNVVSDGAAGLEALGVTPTPLEPVIPTYLYRYRRGGQYAEANALAGAAAPTT